jgi:hypothetical protein
MMVVERQQGRSDRPLKLPSLPGGLLSAGGELDLDEACPGATHLPGP